MPQAQPVTAVTVFHDAGDATAFDEWARELLASAAAAPGSSSGQVAVHDGTPLDRAVAVTFSDESRLHAWLDSPQRADVLTAGQRRGFWRSSVDLVFSDDGPASPGIGLFRHAVSSGREAEFRDRQVQLADVATALPGYEGTILLAGAEDAPWVSIVRFRTGRQLASWMRSPERAAVLQGLRSTLSEDFAVVSNTTPFGTTVRIEDGRALMTPNWKSAILVLVVLYPTVMLLSRFLGPILDGAGAQPWLSLWVSQVVSVTAMQWWLMPAVSRPLSRWLDPVDGSAVRVSAAGAVVLVGVHAATLAVFATVHELQFWDYMTK